MEYKFLVDVNLPKYFQFFNSPQFIHVVDIEPTFTDKEIWDYALQNELVILTKDSDFYDRFISSDHAPKIIYFQLGNQTLKELHAFFSKNWSTILNQLDDAGLLIVTKTDLKVIK